MYEWCCECFPSTEEQRQLFTKIGIAYDKSDKDQGFVLILNHVNFDYLRFLGLALKQTREEGGHKIKDKLVFLERMKALQF